MSSLHAHDFVADKNATSLIPEKPNIDALFSVSSGSNCSFATAISYLPQVAPGAIMSERSGSPSNEGEGDEIRPHGEDRDSSEESSEEDPEEARKVAEGFIVQDEDDDGDEGEAEGGEARRRGENGEQGNVEKSSSYRMMSWICCKRIASWPDRRHRDLSSG